MSKTVIIRHVILILAVIAIMGAYVARLMQIQIVEAEQFRSLVTSLSISEQTVRAARGEIIDRNGNPLAVNRMGYNIVIDHAFFPRDDQSQNEIIERLIVLLENLGEEWVDNLPISQFHPFVFSPGQEAQVSRLSGHLNLGAYANADDAMFWLVERYGLQDFSRRRQRQIAGIRYEMEQRGFARTVPYVFATDVDITTVVKVRERSHELLGVDVTETAIRIHPDGTIAPHIIGTIGPIQDMDEYFRLRELGYSLDDTLGRGGVELSFENLLRGQNGTRQIYVDVRGRVDRAEETLSPSPGNTIVLTLDSEMQRVAHNSLSRQIRNLQENYLPGQGREADSGAVVVLDVRTGEILAAVTYPSFDLNTFGQDYAQLSYDPDNLRPLFNRAISGVYMPGSVFKQVPAVAAMNAGIVDANSTVFCGRVYTFFPDYQPTCMGFHGHINVIRAIQVSCNIYFYDVGRRVGIDAMAQTAAQFGLGVPSGIEIPENIGTISSPEAKANDPTRDDPWVPGDVLQSAIGQMRNEFTPLQMANFAATLANRGQRMNLTLVREVRDYSQRNVISSSSPEIVDTVDASPEIMEAVIQGMVNASHIGTAARYFSNYPVRVASKTGTPQAWDGLNSTFIAFAPADNPEIAIAVVIEKGWHGFTGAPVARDIFDHHFGFNRDVE